MNRRFIPPLVSILAVAFAATAAFAQMGMEKPRMFHVGIGGGTSVPVNDAEKALKNGYVGQIWASINPSFLPISFRASFDLQKHDFKTQDSGVPSIPGASGGTNQVVSGLANARMNLMRGPIEPYITGGLGGYNVTTDSTGASSNSSLKFGINGGAGISVKISKICLYVEGRIDNVYTDKGAIDTKTVQLIPVTFGISY